jgi:AcrR family transcriptional regulator
MSPAALYVHYRTKEDLLFRISRIAHESALAVIPPESSGSGDPAGQLRAAGSAAPAPSAPLPPTPLTSADGPA